MSFLPNSANPIVPAAGFKTSQLCLLGEAPGADEVRMMKPFIGAAGGVLDQCLHAAGIVRGSCYITNVVKERPTKNEIHPFFDGRRFSARGLAWVESLYDELSTCNANCFVALGSTAMAALTGRTELVPSKHKPCFRGYVMEIPDELWGIPTGLGGRKVIPTRHPAAALRGQYILRYYITADLKKALQESKFRELIRPYRDLYYTFSGLNDVLDVLHRLEDHPLLSVDIEVLNYEVSCIGLAPSPKESYSIPIHGRWNEDDEMALWMGLSRLLSNERQIKVFQNGIFDVNFLAAHMGVRVKGPIMDTMVAHHIIYPDMLKSLEFLGSLYCGAQEHWKNMVSFKSIKAED